jgi:hypothetical protein
MFLKKITTKQNRKKHEGETRSKPKKKTPKRIDRTNKGNLKNAKKNKPKQR